MTTDRHFVSRVWVAEGCIGCDVCTTLCFDVFVMVEGTARIRAIAQDPTFTASRSAEIFEAAEKCPADVIKFDTVKASPGAAEEEATALPRRSFVSGTALTVGWVILGGGLGVVMAPAVGRYLVPNVVEEPDPRVRVGRLQRYADMVPGDVDEEFKPSGVWIIREKGRIAALSTICTHLGCVPNWSPRDRVFKCPCHGSGYRADGVNFEGPAPRPLERFRLFIENGTVVVDKSKVYRGELGQWDLPGSYIPVES